MKVRGSSVSCETSEHIHRRHKIKSAAETRNIDKIYKKVHKLSSGVEVD